MGAGVVVVVVVVVLGVGIRKGLSGTSGGGCGPMNVDSLGKKGFRGRSVTGLYLGSVQQIYVGGAGQSLARMESGRID